MKITDLKTIRFKSQSCIQRDPIGHAHPGPAVDTVTTMYVIETDEGVCGYSVPDSYNVLNPGRRRKPGPAATAATKRPMQWQREAAQALSKSG